MRYIEKEWVVAPVDLLEKGHEWRFSEAEPSRTVKNIFSSESDGITYLIDTDGNEHQLESFYQVEYLQKRVKYFPLAKYIWASVAAFLAGIIFGAIFH